MRLRDRLAERTGGAARMVAAGRMPTDPARHHWRSATARQFVDRAHPADAAAAGDVRLHDGRLRILQEAAELVADRQAFAARYPYRGTIGDLGEAGAPIAAMGIVSPPRPQRRGRYSAGCGARAGRRRRPKAVATASTWPSATSHSTPAGL